ncbi:MAG: serine/threonine protein kinase, partial [Phycisphaerae bacterium]|nr:serine/threonine protein kinase [Phycisphaerae bacterium]
YLAKQDKPSRHVAIKVLRRGMFSQSASDRFEIECNLLGRLHHGGIAQVYEGGTHTFHGDRVPWIAMELIEHGIPVTSYAKDKKLTVDNMLKLYVKICEAVAEAHRHGIIHRDLKPENILVDKQDNPKIIDFGVAKVVDPMGEHSVMITQVCNLVGTLQYMSPEQAKGETIDISTDVYSLGVILYELLSGDRPYNLASTTIPGAIETITTFEPKPLRLKVKGLPRDVEIIASQAMATDPQRRYRSANEFCDDIQRVIDGEPISARKEWAISRFLRRKRRMAVAIVIALPLFIATTAMSVYFALQANLELEHNTKLIEFAKSALATRNEIIVTNPEYWETHYQLSIQKAKKISGDEPLLLADMYGLLTSVADSGDTEDSLRVRAARLLENGSERGTLLLIEQCAYEEKKDIAHRIANVQNLIHSIKNPSATFRASALTALANLQLHSNDKTTRDQGREHSHEALRIVKDSLDGDCELNFKLRKTLAWANIFREEGAEYYEEVLDLINDEFVSHCTQKYGAHHPNVLSLANLIGIAYEKLDDYESAIRVLRPAAKEAVESYGVGHNLTWRYLNNLAIALALKAGDESTDSDVAELLTLQATSLWNECIRQSIMHEDNGGVQWYGDTFRDMLPEIAPSVNDLEKWRMSVQFNGDKSAHNFEFMDALQAQ